MKRLLLSMLALAVLAIFAAPALADEVDELAVPEGAIVPRTEVKIETVRTFRYPRTLVTIHQADPRASDRDELLDTFDAQRGPDGTVLTLPERVLFDFGSAELRPTAQDRLERLLLLLEEVDGTIQVIGHTDDVGGDAINQPLSEDRAQAVADHLTGNGVDTGRVETEGRADSEPVEPNQHDDGSDNPEGRQANRRVEVIVQLG